MKKPFILFDFDGVIADSFQLGFVVQKIFCPHLTESQYRRLFEGNINDNHQLADVHSPECRFDFDFFSEYQPRVNSEVGIMSGIKEVIHELSKNFSLVIISSNLSQIIDEFLRRHELHDCFIEVLGNEVHKSKIAKIKMAFDKYQLLPSECLFVTDTLGDVREAAHMEVGAVAVTWGFNTPEILLTGKPMCLVNEPQELLTVIPECLKQINSPPLQG